MAGCPSYHWWGRGKGFPLSHLWSPFLFTSCIPIQNEWDGWMDLGQSSGSIVLFFFSAPLVVLICSISPPLIVHVLLISTNTPLLAEGLVVSILLCAQLGPLPLQKKLMSPLYNSGHGNKATCRSQSCLSHGYAPQRTQTRQECHQFYHILLWPPANWSDRPSGTDTALELGLNLLIIS